MENKVCNKCNVEKTIQNFSKHSGTKDKLDNRCKECVKKVKDNDLREKRPSQKDLVEINLNNKDQQGGKYNGSIFERNNINDSNVFIVSIGGKQKTFNLKNYETKELCLKEAEKYKKKIR